MKKHVENLKTKGKKVQEFIRLNKFISNAGVCSRRSADTLIKEGKILVNGKTVTTPSTKVDPEYDNVSYNNRKIKSFNDDNIYLVFNKPAGCICSKYDERKSVFDYLPKRYKLLTNVGRLDFNTEGILLFTNDKPLIHKLTHPKFGVRKNYLVRALGIIPEEDFSKILKDGIEIDGYTITNFNIRDLRYTDNYTWFEIEVGEGRNREIRKIVETLGFQVTRLKRIAFGKICKRIPPKTKFRLLSNDEISYLKSI